MNEYYFFAIFSDKSFGWGKMYSLYKEKENKRFVDKIQKRVEARFMNKKINLLIVEKVNK